MDGFELFQAVLAILSPLLWVPPLWRILDRTGHNGAWALFGIFPVFALIILWQVANAYWPAVDRSDAPAT